MEGFEDGQEGSPTPAFKAADSPNCASWMQQDSTQSPQTSGNSDSTSTQSLSNSNGDAQVCLLFLATASYKEC